MKNSLVIFVICGALLSTSLYAGPQNSAPAAQSAPADCSQLTPQEQQFSSQLTDENNRMLFCQKMSPAQRSQVMEMTRPDPSGKMMAPDDAVSQYATQNKMVTPAPNKKPSGGCSIK